MAADETMAAPVHWTVAGRFWFRVAFIYFFCFMFLYGNGTIFSLIPFVGNWLDTAFNWPTEHLAEWVGQHVFQLTGIAAKWHPTGSGDTTLNWISNGLFLVYAAVGGIAWTVVAMVRGNRRKEYQTLYAWLRFGLRLTCGFFMLNYGIAKLFPLQMAPISIAILNEPVGNMAPMTFLWALLGMNPAYQMVCGFAEALGGVLFLFRRTALIGALLSAFVMTNVVLYNFFFDVPVKLFAANLLAACLFVVLPDVKALFSFFWKHRPAAPAGVWVPPAKRKAFRVATRVVEIVFALLFVGGLGFGIGGSWLQVHKAAGVKSPLLGAWKLDAGQKATGNFVTPEGAAATDLYVDTVQRAFTRSVDGELWRTNLKIDDHAKTVRIRCYIGEPVKYGWAMPDADHLVLTSVAPEKLKKDEKFSAVTVYLTRTPVPDRYPLLERGFHLVNQWGLER